MYGSGVRIGLGAIRIMSHHRALTACFAAVVGATIRGAAVWLIAATIRPRFASTTSAYAWHSSLYNFVAIPTLSFVN